jgi:ABC-type transport system involved in multi-copper enzyme maturation permease subunit
MFTGTLAMLHRAVRLDARLLRTHLFRAGFAWLVYVSLLYALWISQTLLGAPGLRMFEAMTWLNVVLISLAGVSFFATAITEEKEEDTLGLLKMAGIDPLGILLGKSTSRLLGAALLLLVQFPFTLLAITLGGVTLGQVLAAYFSLTAYMILLANVGLLCSVVLQRGGMASIVTGLVLILHIVAGAGVRAVTLGLVNSGLVAGRGSVEEWLENLATSLDSASIAQRTAEIMTTGFAGNPVGFQVLASLAVAGVCFFLAWAGFNRFTRVAHVSRPTRTDMLALLVGLGRGRRSRPGRRVLFWKEFHFVAGGIPVQIVKFVVYGLMTLTIFWAGERYYNYPFARAGEFVADAMLAVIVIESGLYASVILHDEWRDRTLPLLTMLPIRSSTILYSKIAGCAVALIPALFWLLAGCLIWPDGPEQIGKCFILPSRWFYVLVWLLFLTLTIFFSMVVRWGALPLALAVMAGGSFCAGLCGSPVIAILTAVNQFGGPSAEGGFLLVDLVIGTLIVLLQIDVRRRIEIASSQ